jgi:hypothetical protein
MRWAELAALLWMVLATLWASALIGMFVWHVLAPLVGFG